MIKGIGHVAFVVKDMEQSLHFYCQVLGFEKMFEIPHPKTKEPWIVYLKVRAGQYIELFYDGKNIPEKVEKPIGYSHLCLEVTDIQAIASHLKEQGITLDVEPTQGVDRNYQCWATDPDGNRIEFMQMNPDSLQLRAERGEKLE
ncbi:VOC family protein [Paenibacillus yanchengensis]|uniref:VOC family protein n=1 Tax=Paenibacillus yanchengensis TaxID=2035833 RepID=A0ABW4YFD9_9BACL